MPVLAPEGRVRAQWDALKTLLTTEAQAGGRLYACSWTDALGNAQTSRIVDVRRNTQQFFTDSLDPTKIDTRTAGVCGIQLTDFDPQQYASGRYWLVCLFQITVACMSVTHTSNGADLIANGDDALAQAWSFIEDDNGNGIACILRDRNNWSLKDGSGNNTCNDMTLGPGKPKLYVGTGETPQMWAYIDLQVKTQTPLGR